MKKSIERAESVLVLPTEEALPGLTVSHLHSLWRENEQLLLEQASALDISSIPCLATHGSAADRIQRLAEGDSPLMWVFAAYERPHQVSELLRHLYCLTSAASHYSFLFSEKMGGRIKGDVGMMLFGVADGKQFFDSEGELRDSWKTSNLVDFLPQSMPHLFRAPKLPEEAELQGYVREVLDSKEESEFFDFRRHRAKVIASEWFIPKEQDIKMPVYESQAPAYLLRSTDPDPVINSYRKEMLHRLFCQNLVATMLDRLKAAGFTPEHRATGISAGREAVQSLLSGENSEPNPGQS